MSDTDQPSSPESDPNKPSDAAALEALKKAWGTDLSEGDSYWGGPGVIDTYLEDVRGIARLRNRVAFVVVGVLLALIVSLFCTIHSFTTQIDKATPSVNLKELVSAAKDQPSTASGAAVKAETASTPASAPSAAATVTTGTGQASISTSVLVDISSIGKSVVAVVSILVIAITVLAISLLRSTFSLTPERVRPTSDTDKAKPKSADTGIPLPGVELFKAAVEAFKTLVGKIPSKD